MSIQKNISKDNWEFLVRGRIDGNVANQLEVEILSAIGGGANSIFINLSEADYICSAGIRVLLQYYRQMKNKQKTLCVTRPSPEIDSILDLTGFKELIVEKFPSA
jgi:anti-sigma B factor antagonist